jgi:hypothetical protein
MNPKKRTVPVKDYSTNLLARQDTSSNLQIEGEPLLYISHLVTRLLRRYST